MTKAEQTAVKKYPHGIFDGELGDSLRAACAVGYMQAEKDLALTWEDIPKLIELTGKTFRTFSDAGRQDVPLQQLYEEVLRRFNEQRQKK